MLIPAELRAAARDLADRAAQHPDVVLHLDKCWGSRVAGEHLH